MTLHRNDKCPRFSNCLWRAHYLLPFGAKDVVRSGRRATVVLISVFVIAASSRTAEERDPFLSENRDAPTDIANSRVLGAPAMKLGKFVNVKAR